MEKNEYKFPLKQVALYGKNHYKRTDSIWYDLALCLEKDGYGPFHSYSENSEYTPQQECYKERSNIALLIAGKIAPIMKECRQDEFLTNISPEYSWRVGYYTQNTNQGIHQSKTILPEWEYWEAVVRAYLSELCMSTHNDLGYDNWDLFLKDQIPELKKETESSYTQTI